MKLLSKITTCGIAALFFQSANAGGLCSEEYRDGTHQTGALISNCECFKILQRHLLEAINEKDSDKEYEVLNQMIPINHCLEVRNDD